MCMDDCKDAGMKAAFLPADGERRPNAWLVEKCAGFTFLLTAFQVGTRRAVRKACTTARRIGNGGKTRVDRAEWKD